MKTVCTIPADRLRALLLVAGEKAQRHACIHFDAPRGTLVSTNGNMMFLIAEALNLDSGAPFSVRREPIESVLKLTRATANPDVEILVGEGEDNREVVLRLGTASIPTREDEVKFPGYLYAFPRSAPNGTVAQFDPRLTGKLQEAFRLSMGLPKDRKPFLHLAHNGDGPGVMVCSDPTLIGIVMPYRSDGSAPEWLAEALKRHRPLSAVASAETAEETMAAAA